MTQTFSEKGYKGLGMEGATARWYASLTRKSLDEFTALARRVADETPRGRKVLEVAPGPGYFAIELAKLGRYEVTGLDVSRTFVSIARANAAEERVKVDFREGNVSRMPFTDQTFDFILCRAAFKNFSQPLEALEEMYRVLKPGSQALIIDLRRDTTPDAVYRAIDRMNLGPVDAVITRLTFRFMLLKRAYTRKEFEQLLAQTKFSSVDIMEDLIGLELSLRR